jgi:hypothetical protein
MWKRSAAFLAVTAGAAFLGWNIHNMPNVFASVPSRGLGAVSDVYQSIDETLIAGWFGMMAHSVFVPWTLPFVLFYVWLLVSVWRGADLFQVLFLLALSHSAHTFIYLQTKIAPLTGGALAAGIGALVVCEIATAVLLLWWRRVSVSAPENPTTPPEAEPEL